MDDCDKWNTVHITLRVSFEKKQENSIFHLTKATSGYNIMIVTPIKMHTFFLFFCYFPNPVKCIDITYKAFL